MNRWNGTSDYQEKTHLNSGDDVHNTRAFVPCCGDVLILAWSVAVASFPVAIRPGIGIATCKGEGNATWEGYIVRGRGLCFTWEVWGPLERSLFHMRGLYVTYISTVCSTGEVFHSTRDVSLPHVRSIFQRARVCLSPFRFFCFCFSLCLCLSACFPLILSLSLYVPDEAS